MSDLRFPTTTTEHDIFFVQFNFYDVQPVIIRTEDGVDLGEFSGQDFDRLLNSTFNYDTRSEKLQDTITLPLKTSINEETAGNYDETAMRGLSSIAQAIGNVQEGEMGGMGDLIMSQLRQSKNLPEQLRRGIDLATATAINERMQVFYTGPNRRNYSFEFQLTAKNIKDARLMRQIARKFHFHASPSLANSGTTWNYPNLTSFTFMKNVYGTGSEASISQRQGQPILEQINTLFSSKKCYIENVSVTHGDDRYMQFTDGTDAETGIMTIALTLKEVDYFVQDDFQDEGV